MFALLLACTDSTSDFESFDDEGPGGSAATAEFSIGSMVDSRDGHVYKTIKIGTQVWMAEDLEFFDTVFQPRLTEVLAPGNANLYSETGIVPIAYYYSSSSSARSSSSLPPFENKYTYIAAMNYNAYQDSGYNDGICPPGWHLPTMEEFDSFKQRVKKKCDSTTYCSLADKGWAGAGAYWTSTPTDNGIRINSDYGYKFESGTSKAVYYKVNFQNRNAFEADFASKTWTTQVRCVLGSAVDTAVALEEYAQKREARLAELEKLSSSSAAYQALLSSSAAAYRELQLNAAKRYFNPDFGYLMFTDPRDSMVYGYLSIGGHMWMAENLRYMPDENYLTQNVYKTDSMFYYEVGPCYKFEDVNSVCPTGWHTSTSKEWDDLMAATDGDSHNLMAVDGRWGGATNRTGFTMISTTRSGGGMGAMMIASPFNSADFWTADDTTRTSVDIDTVVTYDTLLIYNDAEMDTLMQIDTTTVYDTTYTEYDCYHAYVYAMQEQVMTKVCYGSKTCSYIRCVMDE